MTRWRRWTWTGASAATQHYVERTLLGYRLAGVDKDKATRDRLQALHEKATRHSLDFSRNIQEGAKTIEATQAELDGLPPDYIARHQPDAGGQITLTTDQPDMQPVMTLCVERGDCASGCFWRTTRARIRRTSRFCSTCWRRGRRLLPCSGFAAGPTWRRRTR